MARRARSLSRAVTQQDVWERRDRARPQPRSSPAAVSLVDRSPANLLALQRLSGNKSVVALLTGSAPARPARLTVQRCGGEVHAGCACADASSMKADHAVQRSPAVTSTAPTVGPCANPAAVFEMSTDRTFKGLMAQTNPDISGMAHPARLKVATATVRDGDQWRLCVTGVTSLFYAESWLAFGEREPTKANATEDNFCEQLSNLDAVSSRASRSRWYMIEATRKHERQHYTEWKNAFAIDWPAVRARIEALSMPASVLGFDLLTKEQATGSLRGSMEFYEATKTDAESGNFPSFWVAHDDATMAAIEHTVVDPRIVELCNHAKTEGWNLGLDIDTSSTGCPTCSAHGVT